MWMDPNQEEANSFLCLLKLMLIFSCAILSTKMNILLLFLFGKPCRMMHSYVTNFALHLIWHQWFINKFHTKNLGSLFTGKSSKHHFRNQPPSCNYPPSDHVKVFAIFTGFYTVSGCGGLGVWLITGIRKSLKMLHRNRCTDSATLVFTWKLDITTPHIVGSPRYLLQH